MDRTSQMQRKRFSVRIRFFDTLEIGKRQLRRYKTSVTRFVRKYCSGLITWLHSLTAAVCGGSATIG
jgi:hypothetical protein